MTKLRDVVRIVLHPFRRRPNVSRNIDKTGDALNLNGPSGTHLDTDVVSKDIPGTSNAIGGDPGDAGRMDASHNDVDKTGDALNPASPSGTQLNADGDDKNISGASNAIDGNPGDACRIDVSHNDVNKAGDALNLDVPSDAQLDTDVGSKDTPGALNATSGDPGDGGCVAVSHTDIDKAGDTLNPNILSAARIDTDVGSKVISTIPNDTDHDPGDSAELNIHSAASFDAWLNENEEIMKMIQDAIYSLEESKVERPLQMYLGFGDVSEVLLEGLGLLAEVHPVSKAVFLSFKAAVKLGTMYQANNKKVGILRLRVQNLLIAIFQLRHVKKSQVTSPDGKTVNIMETVMKDIAGHISRAGSDCSLYMEKLTILRVFGSIKYESVLTDHIATLAADHKRLMRTLQIHTTIEMESMERTLASLKADVKKILRHLDTPEEKGLRDIFEKKGYTSAYILQSIGDDSVDARGTSVGVGFSERIAKGDR